MQDYKIATPMHRNQLKYVLVGVAIGFLGGSTTFFMVFGINIYPFGTILVPAYVLAVSYSIIKYRLLDIEIVLTRAIIFIFVYSLALGIPIGAYQQFQGKMPLSFALALMAVLSSSGSFIYQYLQRRVEERLLEEQRRCQEALRQAALGMNKINEFKKVYNLVVDLIASQMKVEYALVYVIDDENKEYAVAASVYSRPQEALPGKIPADSPLAAYLKTSRGVAVYDDIRHNAKVKQSHPEADVIYVLTQSRLQDALVLPVLIEEDLQGMIVVGKKQSGRIFTKDDLAVLKTLANQTAVAVENCRLWAREVRRMEEQGLNVRSSSIDRMGGSIAHEIDNPNTVIINEAGYILEVLQKDKRIRMPEEKRQEIVKALGFVIDSAKRTSGMIDDILEQSRLGRGGLKIVKINEAIDDFLKIINPRVRQENAAFQAQVAKNLPLTVDKVQVMEILMNLVLNSLHAVRNNQGRGKEVGLNVFLGKDGVMVRLEVADNGYGIPANIIEEIFLPAVTTKAEEGTGLGLYRVKRIVEGYRGKVWAESQGRDKGAKFIIELPVDKDGGPSAQPPPPKIQRIRKLK